MVLEGSVDDRAMPAHNVRDDEGETCPRSRSGLWDRNSPPIFTVTRTAGIEASKSLRWRRSTTSTRSPANGGSRATYTDYNEMFRQEKPDLVSVCVPNFLHHDVVIAASEAGLNVVCEKPLATTVEDAREMVAVTKKNGTMLFYGEDWCFSPTIRRMDALIAEGGIGRVLYAKAKECHNGSHSPFAKKLQTCGGGSFMHLGIHPIGYMLHLLGQGAEPGGRSQRPNDRRTRSQLRPPRL